MENFSLIKVIVERSDMVTVCAQKLQGKMHGAKESYVVRVLRLLWCQTCHLSYGQNATAQIRSKLERHETGWPSNQRSTNQPRQNMQRAPKPKGYKFDFTRLHTFVQQAYNRGRIKLQPCGGNRVEWWTFRNAKI